MLVVDTSLGTSLDRLPSDLGVKKSDNQHSEIQPKSLLIMKQRNLKPLILSLLAVPAGFAGAATLINVDFNVPNQGTSPTMSGTVNLDGGNTLGGGAWNGIGVNRNGSTANVTFVPTTALSDSTGAATDTTVTTTVTNNTYNNAASANIDDSVEALFSDKLYQNGGTTTVTIANLNASTTAWTLVLFGADGKGFDGVNAWDSDFTIGGVTKFTSDSGGIGATLVEGDEYVRFTGTGNSNIVITFASHGGGLAAFNGFQLEQVPEPSAALLGGLGMLALLRRRRA